MYQINFNHPIHVHFMGIGGISMSGLSEILLDHGFTISGSDMKSTQLTQQLESKGIKIFYSQTGANITSDIDLVVYTAAVKPAKANNEHKAFLNIIKSFHIITC